MGDKPRVIYVAHPVRGDVHGNVQRALRWLRWLMTRDVTVAYEASWLAALLSGADDSDQEQRDRGLRDNLALVTRCDAIVLVGGHISTGMRIEMNAAWLAGRGVVDLTHFGLEPPASVTSLSFANYLAGGVSGV